MPRIEHITEYSKAMNLATRCLMQVRSGLYRAWLYRHLEKVPVTYRLSAALLGFVPLSGTELLPDMRPIEDHPLFLEPQFFPPIADPYDNPTGSSNLVPRFTSPELGEELVQPSTEQVSMGFLWYLTIGSIPAFLKCFYKQETAVELLPKLLVRTPLTLDDLNQMFVFWARHWGYITESYNEFTATRHPWFTEQTPRFLPGLSLKKSLAVCQIQEKRFNNQRVYYPEWTLGSYLP